MRPTEYKYGQRNQPSGIRTALGWTLSDQLPKNVANTICADEMIPEQIKKWWGLEAYVSNCKTSGSSKDEMKAIETSKRTATIDGVRYEVGVLWNVNSETFA